MGTTATKLAGVRDSKIAIRDAAIANGRLMTTSTALSDYAAVIFDSFEQTPELRQFPDIRTGLTDSTFKMVVLRGGSASIGIAVTLPSGQSGSINWGDGNTTALTASGAAVNYYHTWNTWQTSTDGLEEYNIITISGNVTAIAAIASTATSPVYWHTVAWLVAKSTTLTSFAISTGTSGDTFRPYGLRRVDFDTPNLVLQRACFYRAPIRYFAFNGSFGSTSSANDNLFFGAMMDEINYSNTGVNFISSIFYGSRIRKINLTLNQTYSVNCSGACYSSPLLRYVSINTAWGNFNDAFSYNYLLKEIDMSACPVIGISSDCSWQDLFNCRKILFPSTGSGVDRVPKPFATGVTSCGNFNFKNVGMDRAALVEMFRSLPTNAVTRNLTITGAPGSADLTAEEIAIAQGKNWNVIRA